MTRRAIGPEVSSADAGNRKPTRFQRSSSQPLPRLNCVSIVWPLNVPLTSAISGPPKISRARGALGDRRERILDRSSLRQASSASGNVPPPGIAGSTSASAPHCPGSRRRSEGRLSSRRGLVGAVSAHAAGGGQSRQVSDDGRRASDRVRGEEQRVAVAQVRRAIDERADLVGCGGAFLGHDLADQLRRRSSRRVRARPRSAPAPGQRRSAPASRSRRRRSPARPAAARPRRARSSRSCCRESRRGRPCRRRSGRCRLGQRLGAVASSTSSTSRPCLRSSSANARPSPTALRRCRSPASASRVISASCTVADAECVITTLARQPVAELDRDRGGRPLAALQDRLAFLGDELPELVGLEESCGRSPRRELGPRRLRSRPLPACSRRVAGRHP